MRLCTLLVLLLFCLPALAQEADYPTLDALANMEVPPVDYADLVGRMNNVHTSYQAPTDPPQYKVGDREAFRMIVGEDVAYETFDMELRAILERALIWVQRDINYPQWRAEALAQKIERLVLDPMQRLFQFAEPPGIDGDPRLYVALIYDSEGHWFGYFHEASTRPKDIYSSSNQHEMLAVNLYQDDEYDFFDDILVDAIAHEYLHILQFHSDFGEDLWLDEGLATYAGYVASAPILTTAGAHYFGDIFLSAPHTGLTHFQAVEDRLSKYGAAVLFVIYLVDRFGADIIPPLLLDKAHGWPSVVKVLREHAGVSADEVFADWVLANYFLDSRRGYGYPKLEAELTGPEPAASYNSFPAAHAGHLPQFSTEYIAVDARGAAKLRLRLRQDPVARLIDEAPVEGDHFAYALTSDRGHSSLTRAFDLSEVERASLEFRLWHDLVKDKEYAYVTLSDDGGATWHTLKGIFMRPSEVNEDIYPRGYTGRTPYWFSETISLSAYAPGQVLIRFELLSRSATKYRGLAIDDLRIEAIGYHEGFEAPDDSWLMDGWIRSDNRLPNYAWLQAVQDSGDELHVSRALLSGGGELTVELQPGAGQVLVAISPVVPYTGLKSEFQLELNLLDAAGDVMVLSRECTVTTNAALNFRATPNGQKIGLVPEGASLDALERQGDWFMVDYRGRRGWISASYVQKAGNCP